MRWHSEKFSLSPKLGAFALGELSKQAFKASVWAMTSSEKSHVQHLKHCIFPVAILSFASAAHAVDAKRLWLPTKHAPLFLELKQAAEAAEALDRCTDLMSGTIDLDQSQEGHPIYRFLCRQENGKTYNEMVDGISFKTLTTVNVLPKEPTEEELEALRLEEEKRKEEARLARINALWVRCESKLKEKTRLLKNVEWLETFPPKPEVWEEQKVQFYVQFNAKSYQGDALQYEARCNFRGEDALKVKISGRKD